MNVRFTYEPNEYAYRIEKELKTTKLHMLRQ